MVTQHECYGQVAQLCDLALQPLGGRRVGPYQDPGPVWKSTNLVFAWDDIAALIEAKGLDGVGEPHVRHIEGRLWEMRLRGRGGISRALYEVEFPRRVVITRGFIKKTHKTPDRELKTARKRMRALKRG